MPDYYVYVIGLRPEFAKTRRARKANPDYKEGKPCVYVGYTSKTPEERYRQHITDYVNKKGHHLASRVVLKYGYKRNGLRPRRYRKYNPISSQEEAKAVEIELAEKLRRKGYCVWQN